MIIPGALRLLRFVILLKYYQNYAKSEYWTNFKIGPTVLVLKTAKMVFQTPKYNFEFHKQILVFVSGNGRVTAW